MTDYDERAIWSPGSGLFNWLLVGEHTPPDRCEKHDAAVPMTLQNATYHPELIDWVHDRGGSYQCPDCGERLQIRTDVVVIEDAPAMAVELACSGGEDCGYVTRGLIESSDE